MTKISWDIQQCPLAKRCRARWEKLEPVLGAIARYRECRAWSTQIDLAWCYM